MATKLILDSGWSKGLKIIGPWIALGRSVTFPVQHIALNQTDQQQEEEKEKHQLPSLTNSGVKYTWYIFVSLPVTIRKNHHSYKTQPGHLH